MQILISSVKIPNRVRKDLGDLESLMDSLKRCGQLNPVTVTRDMVLIAGHRRFEAASQLGWRMIDAMVVDGIDETRRLEIELEENIHRKDFSPEELLDGVRRLDELRRPRPMKRLVHAVRKVFSSLAFWRYFGKHEKPAEDAMARNDRSPDQGAAVDGSARKQSVFRRSKGGPSSCEAPDDDALGI